MNTEFIVDLAAPSRHFAHFWEHTIGSGHATLALRADWQKQLLRAHRELGFEHVRFHGILSDDMCTLVDESDKLIYSFYNADQICDFLVSSGMSPFIEFSFMPSTLSSGNTTAMMYKGNVTPPKDYMAWQTLIHTLVSHWKERYGAEVLRSWFFEIWNEPNLTAFWTGTQQEYFLLYQHAVKAIKAVDPAFQVGGPATASNAWITEFQQFCEKNEVPYDFISTHHYPTDAFGKPGDDTLAQLADSKRSILREQVMATREKAGTKPVYYTEWSTSSNPFDLLHDQPYAAAYITKTIMEAQGLVQGYSYWTFSDIFEENYFSSIPFHGGFGLLNIYGIPKPAYRAYELLHRLGDASSVVKGEHPTVDVWALKNLSIVNILLTNSALPRHPVKTELVKIRIENVPKINMVYIERVDDSHANAWAAWVAMGKPGTLDPAQVTALESASRLVKETLHFSYEEDAILLEIQLPPQGTALITLETA